MARFPKAWLALMGAGLLPLQAGALHAQAQDLPLQQLPLAPSWKGSRPKSNPKVLAPAAIKLPPELQKLPAPATLALPNKVDQVRIKELRPLTLRQAETLAEVNNPNLKAIASQVDQAQSDLRAALALWYPTLSLSGTGFPAYTGGSQRTAEVNPATTLSGNQYTYTDRWAMSSSLSASWDLINPKRVPEISAARDRFEKAKNAYLIGLRDLRLQIQEAYIDLQRNDQKVVIGKESVRVSLVALRDAKARFQAGVATKLEVLEAETQLARDQRLLTDGLTDQVTSRRLLARFLDLPQNISPTAADPLVPQGIWTPTLEESIVAAFAFREELDSAILDISASNSSANSALGDVQPLLRIVNGLDTFRYNGTEQVIVDLPGSSGWAVENSIGLNFSWTLFDGGRSQALARKFKQQAQQNAYSFADKRDKIRYEVEETYNDLRGSITQLKTGSRQVISSREALRLARLRFQAGVSTQREVVNNQRDVTQAETDFNNFLASYNFALAQLRRRTGLDQVVPCKTAPLPALKPLISEGTDVPVPPLPLTPVCLSMMKGS